MKTLRITIVVLLLPAILWAADESNDVRISIRHVTDRRSTGQFSSLGIELNVMGELVRNVKEFRLHIHNAQDDVGTDLPASGLMRLDYFDTVDGEPPYFRIGLKNPSRQANYVKELSGSLELFIPENDENSVVTIKNMQQQTGSAIQSKALEQAGVELLMFTMEQLKNMNSQQQSKGKPENSEVFAHAAAQALTEYEIHRYSEHTITCIFKDPHLRVLDIKFLYPNGNEIRDLKRRTGRRSNDITTSSFDFYKPLPMDTIVKVYLETDKAMMTVPFRLTNIALP